MTGRKEKFTVIKCFKNGGEDDDTNHTGIQKIEFG